MDRIEEGEGVAKKRKKPHNSCRRDVGNGEDLGGNRKKRRQESIGSVATDPGNLENSKEAGREAQGMCNLIDPHLRKRPTLNNENDGQIARLRRL